MRSPLVKENISCTCELWYTYDTHELIKLIKFFEKIHTYSFHPIVLKNIKFMTCLKFIIHKNF
jgi:hypothetical protein